MKILLCLLLSTAACFAFSKAGTVYTTNGSLGDVQAAIDDASTGDTINIGSGTFTWSENLALYKPVTLRGNGTASTHLILPASPAISPTGTNWRITGIDFQSTGGYIIEVISGANYGLIDHCKVTGTHGEHEWFFMRGPLDSWQTNNSLGGPNNIFIEDCLFMDQGYTDGNDNSRVVCRFNVITGAIKFDLHGKYSNSLRGGREVEIYHNYWTDGGFYNAMELRGGTAMVFNNNVDSSSFQTPIRVREYYELQGGLGAADYPIIDQVGVGKDPKVAASEPYYLWGNTSFSTSQWFVNCDTPETVQPNRDYYEESIPFTASSGGVGVGTRAQMDAISPTVNKVGFWVTNEGEWNSTNGATPDGRLYQWNGTAWVLYYTPYTYPHPLQSGSPEPTPTPGIETLNVENLRIGP